MHCMSFIDTPFVCGWGKPGSAEIHAQSIDLEIVEVGRAVAGAGGDAQFRVQRPDLHHRELEGHLFAAGPVAIRRRVPPGSEAVPTSPESATRFSHWLDCQPLASR